MENKGKKKTNTKQIHALSTAGSSMARNTYLSVIGGRLSSAACGLQSPVRLVKVDPKVVINTLVRTHIWSLN